MRLLRRCCGGCHHWEPEYDSPTIDYSKEDEAHMRGRCRWAEAVVFPFFLRMHEIPSTPEMLAGNGLECRAWKRR